MNFLIPKNVKSRFEFFPGFGFRELGWLIMGLAVGTGISFLFFLVTNSLFSFAFSAFAGTIGFIAGKPDPRSGLNGVDHFKAMRKFRSNQKLYFYRHGDGR